MVGGVMVKCKQWRKQLIHTFIAVSITPQKSILGTKKKHPKKGNIGLLCMREESELSPGLKNMTYLLPYPIRIPFLSVCVYRSVLLL